MHFEAHFFYHFYLQCGENFLVTKGGQYFFFLRQGGSIKCPAGGGIRTLPFRRGVTVPIPPHAHVCIHPMPFHVAQHFSEKFQSKKFSWRIPTKPLSFPATESFAGPRKTIRRDIFIVPRRVSVDRRAKEGTNERRAPMVLTPKNQRMGKER